MSHNRNPEGRNGHPPVLKDTDPKLVAALTTYHRALKTNNTEISKLLKIEHNIKMSPSTVKRRRAKLGLTGSGVTTRTMPHDEKVELIISEMDNDPSKGHGLDNIRARIAFVYNVHLTRDFISDIMHTHDIEGFTLREPTSKKILRVVKAPVGIHERWSGDGHDKLYSIGFPIWAVVDDATSKWLKAWVVPSNRLGVIIGYLYLCLVEEFQGMPLQFTTDCGSETTQAFGYGNALRSAFFPEVDSNILPPHVYVRSVHNISIERSWLRLRLDWGNNAVLVFNQGVTDGLYLPHDQNHYMLCQWLWPKLLQQELNLFIEFRNGVRMRKDKNKAGPSGCSRNNAFTLHEEYGLKNCLLRLDANQLAIIRDLKEQLGGEQLLSFVPLEFSLRAEAAYTLLQIDKLSMQNVWHIFQLLLPIVYPAL